MRNEYDYDSAAIAAFLAAHGATKITARKSAKVKSSSRNIASATKMPSRYVITKTTSMEVQTT